MRQWGASAFEGLCAAILMDAVVIEVGDGQVANRPVDAGDRAALAGSRMSSRWWAGPVARARAAGRVCGANRLQ